MEPIFVRDVSAAEPATPTATTAAEIVHEIRGARATSSRQLAKLEISKSGDAGFFPLDTAVRSDATLRERFAAALDLPRASRYRKLRPFLFLGLIPSLMLFELDRELAMDAIPGASARLALGLVILVVCTSDLLRPIPRHPRVTALMFLAAGARFALLLARSCASGAHPLILAAPFLALTMAVATTAVSPTRERISRDIDDALGLGAQASISGAAKSGSAWGALAIAVLLPVALIASGRAFGLWGQALVMVTWGLVLPQLAVPNVDHLNTRRSPYFSWSNVIGAALVGVTLTATLTGGVHYAVDAVAYAVQCTHTAASEGASRFMSRETAEVSRNVNEAQHDIAFFLMTAFLAPLVEERVYRGALQRVMGARFGATRAIMIAAAVFGFAHLGIYRVAIYQTLLLGVAFGIAFEEGGLLASIATHVVWNVYLLL